MVSTQARVGSINVLLAVQFGQATAGLNRFAGTVERTGMRTQRSVGNIDRSVGHMNQSLARINARGFTGVTVGALRASTAMDQLRGLALAAGVAMGGLVPAVLASGMIRIVDSAHRMSNQLRTVTTDSTDLRNTQDALFDVAQRTRSAFDSTVVIYARTARATEHLSLSQAKLLRITETVQKAFAVGGASTAEAQGAAIQLSQGIASDRFSGEEYRSVAENAPVLLRGMADAIGVNIGRLREMAHAGELTAAVVTQAILEASEAIDADFAKTTSTIEQAWVRVGNAVTKYAMDSEGAAASSSAIVMVLSGLADNIDTVADSLLLLGVSMAGIGGGRAAARIVQWMASLKAARAEVVSAAQANVALANAEMQTARSEFVSRRLAFNRALRDGTLSARQLERQKRSLTAASAAYRASVTQASMATTQLATAQRAATYSSMALAAAGRTVSAAWSFIGGPFGAALLGIGAAMYVLSSESAKAQAEMARMAEAGDQVVSTLARIEGRATDAGTALERFARGFRDIINVEGMARAQAELNALRDLISDMGGQLNVLRREFSASAGLTAAQSVELADLTSRFQVGSLSVSEYTARLQEMARANPDQSGIIADMIDLAQQADDARDAVGEAARAIEALDGKSATVTITVGTRQIDLTNMGVGERGDRLAAPLSEDRFNARFGGRYAQSWEDLFPELFRNESGGGGGGGGGGRSRRTADDRFQNSLQELQDRTQALREEREAINLGYADQLRRQEGLKLEQEALQQVREEARRKGEQDWQNAALSEEQVRQIHEKVDAHVAEAMALKKLTEEQEAYKEAAGEVGGIIRSMLDGSVELKDVFLQLIPVVVKLMNSMNVAAGGKGIFGGGVLQSLIGGFLGISFHSGGTVGQGGKVGPMPSGVPFAGKFHGGGDFGARKGKHGELMALVEANETILTARNTDRAIGALDAAMSGMKDRAPSVVINAPINAQGADPAALERVRRSVQELSQNIPKMIVAQNVKTTSRRTRP